MGRYFSLTLHGFTPRPRAAKQIGAARPRGVLFLSLAVILGAAYILVISSASTKGYEIQNLEGRLGELRESNRKLEVEMSGLKSIQRIEGEVKKLNLVPGGEMKYLSEQNYAFEQ